MTEHTPAADPTRRDWIEMDPTGVRYRVVIGPRGTWLRGGSVATDLSSALVEIVAGALISSGTRDGSYKLGVLRTKAGIERLVLKDKMASQEEAVARAEEIRAQIRQGSFGARTAR